MKKAKHRGATLEQFLEEEGILEEVDAAVTKRLFADHLAELMRAKRVSKDQLAKRMGTSRTVVYDLLNPKKTSATFTTAARAATALGKRFDIRFVAR